jgi:hypothetical protein
MDVEKELQLVNIRGKYLKEWGMLGDMMASGLNVHPFVKATIGKSTNRTEGAKKGGQDS